MLDAVLEDAHDVRRRVSRADQQKLEEYLQSVREVEQRLDRAGKRGEFQGWRPTLTELNMDRPADGYPQDVSEHMRRMKNLVGNWRTESPVRPAGSERQNSHRAACASGRAAQNLGLRCVAGGRRGPEAVGVPPVLGAFPRVRQRQGPRRLLGEERPDAPPGPSAPGPPLRAAGGR